MGVFDPTTSPVWPALTRHREALGEASLSGLFADDPERFMRFSHSVAGLTVDLSRQLLTGETLALLLDLAAEADIAGRTAALYAGQKINTSEDRAVLHVALRDPGARAYRVDGVDVAPDVAAVRGHMLAFAGDVLEGRRRGATGELFDRIVVLGIGGSDLGPRAVVTALADLGDAGLAIDFVSTLDGTALETVLARAAPERTLILVCSKSFKTLETMTNAARAKDWLIGTAGEQAVSGHFIAVTARADLATAFGLAEDQVFPMWDWVGGRFSLWSAIGLPIALAGGPDAFNRLLAGAYAMDRHFETAEPENNLPLLLGLIDVWNTDFWGATARAVLPYDHALRLLPAYLQQLVMESNGKGVRADGRTIRAGTAPVVFGGAGPDSQHSFMQLLHQGPRFIPAEFLIALNAPGDRNRDALIANVAAQAAALAHGQPAGEFLADSGEKLAAQRACPGNRPSTTILLDSLSPETFGALLALYEHRVFVEGALWGLNSFDQWGVELGKTLASGLLQDLQRGRTGSGHDSSTKGLLNAYRARSKQPDP